MAKYLFHGSYTQTGIQGVLKDGGSGRRKAIDALAESLGGRVESAVLGVRRRTTSTSSPTSPRPGARSRRRRSPAIHVVRPPSVLSTIQPGAGVRAGTTTFAEVDAVERGDPRRQLQLVVSAVRSQRMMNVLRNAITATGSSASTRSSAGCT